MRERAGKHHPSAMAKGRKRIPMAGGDNEVSFRREDGTAWQREAKRQRNSVRERPCLSYPMIRILVARLTLVCDGGSDS